MSFLGTKEIETERLILRPFKLGDEVAMFKNYCNDERVCEFLTWKPHKNIEVTKEYLQVCCLEKYNLGLTYKWAIVLKETNEVIGAIDVINYKIEKHQASLGYVLGYNFWGKGFMPEAGKAVINHLFNEGFVRVDAWHHIKNEKSGKVMQKMGMTYEGTLKKFDMDKDGKLQDMKLYAIVKN